MGESKRVLFVCIENSNRSQIAEAFARIHGGEKIQAYSAGSRPSGKINPKAIESMREPGYDLGAHQSITKLKSLNWPFISSMEPDIRTSICSQRPSFTTSCVFFKTF